MKKKASNVERMAAYKKYMGPSGNGMNDKKLMRLAGWTSFCAGWDAALASRKMEECGSPINQRR